MTGEVADDWQLDARELAAGGVDTAIAWTAPDTWRRLGITRHAAPPHLDRIWTLCDSASAYDAMDIALAEALRC